MRSEKGDLGGYLQASRRLPNYNMLVVSLVAIVLISGLEGAGQGRWIGLAIVVLVFSILILGYQRPNGVQH